MTFSRYYIEVRKNRLPFGIPWIPQGLSAALLAGTFVLGVGTGVTVDSAINTNPKVRDRRGLTLTIDVLIVGDNDPSSSCTFVTGSSVT